ncbi:hypothetical protein HYV22_03395 [Candidatus Gottesmanbacteria bacterium]|nr:hypothetical protein [Candidatus Gottesmanbacteria bacterium]
MPTNLTLDTFIDKLLDEKHAGVSIPAENREQMKQEMMTALNKMISLKMLEQLSPIELQEFQGLEDKNATDDQLQAYITDHVGPKIKEKDVFFAQILNEFKNLYLG